MKGAGGMQQFIRQANQMQKKVKRLEEELAEKEYNGTSGGGAVEVTVKGENTLSQLKIDDEVFKSGDVEMLQDLLLTAANDALKQAKDTHDAEMEKLTGQIGLPGMMR